MKIIYGAHSFLPRLTVIWFAISWKHTIPSSLRKGNIIKKSNISPGSKCAESINTRSISFPISLMTSAAILPVI